MSKFVFKKGVSVVEVLVGSAILALVLFAFTSSLSIYSDASADTTRRTQALYLAEEGVEIMRGIRDEGWDNIKNLKSISQKEGHDSNKAWRLVRGVIVGPDVHALVADQVVYGFEFDESQGRWRVVEGEEVVGAFTRTVAVQDVYRDAQDEVTDDVSGVYYDDGTRLIRVEIKWTSRRGTQSLALEALLTDIFEN